MTYYSTFATWGTSFWTNLCHLTKSYSLKPPQLSQGYFWHFDTWLIRSKRYFLIMHLFFTMYTHTSSPRRVPFICLIQFSLFCIIYFGMFRAVPTIMLPFLWNPFVKFQFVIPSLDLYIYIEWSHANRNYIVKSILFGDACQWRTVIWSVHLTKDHMASTVSPPLVFNSVPVHWYGRFILPG